MSWMVSASIAHDDSCMFLFEAGNCLSSCRIVLLCYEVFA